MCFVRKNRTLRAAFLGTQTVLEMLSSNYRVWCAQNDIIIENGPLDAEASDEADVMEVDKIEEDDEWSGIMDDEDAENDLDRKSVV